MKSDDKTQTDPTEANQRSGEGFDAAPCYASSCGRVTLYLGDCLEILPTVGMVDSVITDPPYGVSYQSNMRKNKFAGMANEVPSRRMVIQPRLQSLIEFFGLSVRSCIVWDKGRGGMGDLVGSYAPSYESILVAARGRNALKSGRKRDVISCQPHRGERLHPTQKPVDLFIGLIEDCTDTGGIVLDPFMGSGTTGIACIRAGRRFVGIELDPAHYATALERITNELAQGDLFLGHNVKLNRRP